MRWCCSPTPAFALGDSHISLQLHFELSAVVDRVELFHAPPEGNRPGRLIIAVPPSQARDDPASPREAANRMRFFCRSVLPSSVGTSASRVSISGSAKTVEAG